MGDWLLNLPIPWMALVIFAAIYFVAAVIYLVVIRLAKDDLARAFKALSPGMLPPLGIIFGLLVGFIAVGVWNDFDRAKVAVGSEASALRGVLLLAESLPDEQQSRVRALINRGSGKTRMASHGTTACNARDFAPHANGGYSGHSHLKTCR
jgi:hypothetical protein